MSRWTIEKKIKLLDAIEVCIVEHPIVGQWITEILDRKTENSSEKPNNFDKDTNVRSKAVYDKWGNVFDARADIEDEPQTDCCETCKHKNDGWDSEACDPCSRANSNYEPQTDCPWK